MNSTEHNSCSAAAPARNYSRPSDREILDGLEPVDYQISELRRAAMVADEYVNMEFREGNSGNFREHCLLESEQVDGILYTLRHLRNLTSQLEKATDRAYGREVAQ
ncbi:hypothetical protein ABK249_12005 [Neorhizobium sp. Rsf11]|uniref:Uncharacterized protein n=1 Tax=Neorhizobium phenanthreniclasticum TaxID=3157917 RepID=A0ABV0M1B3_9HYPH